MAKEFNRDCLICGSEICYSTEIKPARCHFCGREFPSNAVCSQGHFVCDACHAEKALSAIENTCRSSREQDALKLAEQLMKDKWVHMHGPEHHYLVAAALLTAYQNRGYAEGKTGWDTVEILREAKKRGAQVPGGFCGFWGCCGAAVSGGIFGSLAMGVTPLSNDERGAANRLTAQILQRIAENGGPRCCKRETFLAILETSAFAEKEWGTRLTEESGIACGFFPDNRECIGERCPFNTNRKRGER